MRDMRLLNRPIKLHWAGWETDTLALSRNGWQISAEQNIHSNTIMIAIKHPEADVQGLSEIDNFYHEDLVRGSFSGAVPTSLRFNTFAQNVYVNTTNNSGFDFHAVDGTPRYVNREINRLEDLANFATVAEVPSHEIYLKEANIDQILEMALQRQEPDQEKIRTELRREQELRQFKTGKLHTELRLVV